MYVFELRCAVYMSGLLFKYTVKTPLFYNSFKCIFVIQFLTFKFLAMKKLLLLAMLCCIAFVSNAQFNSIVNRTRCSIIVTQVCHTPPQCQQFVNWSIAVPPGAVIPMPMPKCPPPNETSYRVCWAACPGICTAVAGQLPPVVCIGGLPLNAPLGPCNPCPPAMVKYDPMTGSVIVQ